MMYRLNRVSMRRFKLMSILLLAFLCGNVWAQATPEKREKTGPGETELSEKGRVKKNLIPVEDTTKKPESVSAEKEIIQKNEKTKISGKRTKKKENSIKQEKPDSKQTGSNINGSVLFVDEGEYKYLRIPGYKPERRAKKNENTNKEGELVRIPDKIEIEDTKEESVGLFGFNRETSDMFVKIFLGVMVLSVFILYRVRSRKKSSKVLRRYPNR